MCGISEKAVISFPWALDLQDIPVSIFSRPTPLPAAAHGAASMPPAPTLPAPAQTWPHAPRLSAPEQGAVPLATFPDALALPMPGIAGCQ